MIMRVFLVGVLSKFQVQMVQWFPFFPSKFSIFFVQKFFFEKYSYT